MIVGDVGLLEEVACQEDVQRRMGERLRVPVEEAAPAAALPHSGPPHGLGARRVVPSRFPLRRSTTAGVRPHMMPPHYIAIPKSGNGPGVLVLHSWWGLNAFFRGLCDRLARAGFVALAPDLYDGKVATSVDAAKRLRTAATATRRVPAYKMLMAAINFLSQHEAVTSPRVALVGFSMGGHWALWLAQRPELPIASTVIYYAARNGDYTRSDSRFLPLRRE